MKSHPSHLNSICRAVRTVGGDGFDHISNRQDSRFEKNLFPFKTLWISGAIHPLVMLENDRSDGPGELYILQDIMTGLGVSLDQAEFQRRKLGWFA